MSYDKFMLYRKLEELDVELVTMKNYVNNASSPISINYDLLSKIFWTDDGGFLDNEYDEVVNYWNRAWRSLCDNKGVAFHLGDGYVQVGLLDITDFDNVDKTMSNILSRALGDKRRFLRYENLKDLSRLNLNKLHENGVTYRIIDDAINYINNSITSELKVVSDVRSSIWKDARTSDMIDFFAKELFDAYKWAYDDVVKDLEELVQNPKTHTIAQELLDELNDGFFGIWYNKTIKNNQLLSRISEIAEIRNQLMRKLSE